MMAATILAIAIDTRAYDHVDRVQHALASLSVINSYSYSIILIYPSCYHSPHRIASYI